MSPSAPAPEEHASFHLPVMTRRTTRQMTATRLLSHVVDVRDDGREITSLSSAQNVRFIKFQAVSWKWRVTRRSADVHVSAAGAALERHPDVHLGSHTLLVHMQGEYHRKLSTLAQQTYPPVVGWVDAVFEATQREVGDILYVYISSFDVSLSD